MKATDLNCAALFAAAVVAGTVMAGPSASAAPFALKAALSADSQPLATTVDWHRGGGWGWRVGWFGPGPAILGGVILGGALVATAVAEHREDARAMRHCTDDFPSFNPRTGTFINRHGEERVCPYLY